MRARWLIWTAVALAVLALGLKTVSVGRTESFRIDWYVVAGGGGSAGAPSVALEGTPGQGVVGAASSASYRLGAGYWVDTASAVPPPGREIYLPLVLRILD
jgi:hypothetical protein